MNPSPNRVVVTGTGPVTAIGIGHDAFRKALINGRHAIGEVTRFDPENYGSTLGAEIHDFQVETWLESQKAYLDPACEFALAAASLAIRESALTADMLASARCGLATGSAGGALETMTTYFEDLLIKGPRFVKPFLFQHTYSNTPAGLAAIEFGIRGHHANFASGRTSSAAAIGAAIDQIRLRAADVMIVGGYEALSEALYAGLAKTGRLSSAPCPADYAGPFDTNSTGLVPGEGAVFLVLESIEHARGRGANILAEVSECVLGATSAPSASAIASPVDLWREALDRATVAWDDLGLISLSASGDKAVDTAELAAAHELTAGGKCPNVTALLSRTGEVFGASTVFQAMEAICAMEDGIIPPIHGLKTPLPSAVGLCGPAGSSDVIDTVLLSSVDGGGSASAIVLSRKLQRR